MRNFCPLLKDACRCDCVLFEDGCKLVKACEKLEDMVSFLAYMEAMDEEEQYNADI